MQSLPKRMSESESNWKQVTVETIVLLSICPLLFYSWISFYSLTRVYGI